MSLIAPLAFLFPLAWAAPGPIAAPIAAPIATPIATGGEDLRAQLQRLTDPSSAERRAAELWLARHLTPEDLGVLAEAAIEFGLEARARLASAIGSDEEHFSLAALLASDHDPLLGEMGADALRRMMERWWQDVELAPIGRGGVTAALAGNFASRLLSLEVGSRSLDEELNSVVRHMGVPEGLPQAGPIAVVLDPVLYAASLKEEPSPGNTRAGSTMVLAPERLLFAVIEEHGSATIEGFAMDGPRTWLHVAHRVRAGKSTGGELILDWCRAVLEEPDDPLAEGAARALAATGWPAALDWLARRWAEFGDRRALSGLLLAAERGRVAPSLAGPDSVARLLAAADEALGRGKRLDVRFAEEVQRALGAFGGLANGDDLTEIVARDFDALPSASQRLRLGVLADLGRLPAPLARALRARLEAADQPAPALAIAMVRTLALCAPASGAVPFVWNDPTPMFHTERRLAFFPIYDRWLAASGARPPESWRTPEAAASAGVTAANRRARVAVWWLSVEPGAEAAAEHLIDLVAELDGGISEAKAGDLLARVARRGDRGAVERLFARARERGGDPTGLDRLELLAGGLDSERRTALLMDLTASGMVIEKDLQLLGVLAAEHGAPGPEAREAFLAYLAVGTEESRTWSTALERSLALLRGADAPRYGRRRIEEAFLLGLRSELRESNHPSAQRLRTGTWPRQPWLEPLPLETLEVRLGPDGS